MVILILFFALYSYDKSINKIACWRIHNNSKRTADSYYPWLSQMLTLSDVKIDDITGNLYCICG